MFTGLHSAGIRCASGALILALLPALAGCLATPPRPSSLAASLAAPLPSPEGGVVRTATSILLYVPNRVLDLAEIARAGVNAGPGVGVDVRGTRVAQVVAVSRTSIGLGYQGLRRLPIMAASESAVGVGPVELPASAGLSWYKADLDLRMELHPLLAGVHVAVDLGEIVDFLAGIINLDPADDDL